MGRLVRILLYAFIILILYFWITAIVRSYQKREEVQTIKEAEVVDTSASSTEIDTTLIGGDALTNEQIIDGTLDYEALDDKVQEIENKQEVKKAKEAQSSNDVAKNAKDPKPVKNIVSDDGGSYMVMAGSYLLKDNAEKMVKKLKSMGYKDAKIVVFTSSGYHSVVALSYASESSAKSAAASLKSKGVDCFVRSR